MTSANIAVKVLTKLVGNDPRAPKPSEVIRLAWVEHFDHAPDVAEADALEAVRVIYRDGPPERLPAAGDVIAEARRIAGIRNSRRNADTIALCHDCDECGWTLGPDGLVADPAVKCGHPAVAA